MIIAICPREISLNPGLKTTKTPMIAKTTAIMRSAANLSPKNNAAPIVT